MSQELALLIECSADLKRDLVQFLHGPRFERPLTVGQDGDAVILLNLLDDLEYPHV